MNGLKVRKRNRLKKYDYSAPGVYFITVCCEKRINYLWNTVYLTDDDKLTEYGKITKNAIENIEKIYANVKIKNYVIMPDHIHMLIWIRSDVNGRPMIAPTVSRIVNQFKGFVSKNAGRSIWQKSFYDHIIRDRQDYDMINKYINDNPVYVENDIIFNTNRHDWK